ncbi:MAG TPA: elongation factor 4 [Planctomycetes bacterium]|nr:elongation factor 4 [Planctomycetota bacterium]HIK81812.1 elongation factor 4 [Planctomycetota bacterium]
MSFPIERIRNFSIVAHIDHGKSTLADRLLLKTETINERDFKNQLLDDMDLEKERGITIKAKSVRMEYTADDGLTYQLNLIDTPGHVDFGYEVSRSLAACEGALLVVDAAQGVEAQTVANAFLAIEGNLEIIPVMNKIDLNTARPDEIDEEMTQTFGFKKGESIRCSAKSGVGIDELLEAITTFVPHPKGERAAPLQALIFDSHYDEYRGVIIYVCVKQGVLRKGEDVILMSSGRKYLVDDVGVFTPGMTPTGILEAGEVGYFFASIKTIHDVRIGDTVTTRLNGATESLAGFKNPNPMVYCGTYPAESGDYEDLRTALDKLWLNDPSFTFLPESSDALGFGFRCGFLGLLHMEIVQERLERESGISVVQTAPTVTYEILQKDQKTLLIDSPSQLPDVMLVEEIREPIVDAHIIVPTEFIGAVMKLMDEKRGEWKKTDYLSPTRVQMSYEAPLAEIISDFYDKLKSSTRGYGTLDYTFNRYRKDSLVRLNILVNGESVDALSVIIHKDIAERKGRLLLKKLKNVIPRHMFQVALQASIGGKIIARETIRALMKNVTAKCYGGDISRKRKLLEKQKEGKKRMKQVGSVAIPQDAFMAILRLDEEDKKK